MFSYMVVTLHVLLQPPIHHSPLHPLYEAPGLSGSHW